MREAMGHAAFDDEDAKDKVTHVREDIEVVTAETFNIVA